MKEGYTLALAEDLVSKAGLLPLLLEGGIERLSKITFSGSKYVALPGTRTTKFLKIRNFHMTLFETDAENIPLREFLEDCILNGLPIDRQVKKAVFASNGHVFTLIRKGRNKYRVSHIDGKSTADAFSKDEIMTVRKGSIFETVHSGICKIQQSALKVKTYECDFEEVKT